MRLKCLLGAVVVAAFGTSLLRAADRLSPFIAPTNILAVMQRVADWQLANPSKHWPDDWTQGAGYAGIMALAELSQDAKYRDAMVTMGEKNQWRLGKRKFHADDHTVGQTYVELFLKTRDERMIAPMRAQFDEIIANPANLPSLNFRQKGVQDLWSWCDALFMSPPAWLRLAKATGDQRYRDFAVSEWWRTSNYLYDTNEHLYFRDSTYFNKREANGRKVFWSRGNGWVMGGLVRSLQYLAKDDPARPRFEQQFKEMSAAIFKCQQPDGLWRASLLDPESYPLKETSGSGFYTYALAWGINQGFLDRAIYEPAVRKAWSALVECVAADGKLTHVQPIGADPRKFDENATEIYGVGAFLLAGSEVYKLAKPPSHAGSESPAQRDARTAWWRAARYGMFIHWDMSSIAGTEISWSRQATKPLDIYKDPAGYVEDPHYDNLYKQFNPTNFDARAWTRLAKAAGMKYLVFTAKHHGGFCMWDTKFTEYSIMNTPFQRDVVKELAEACRAEGLRFGLYYSQRDWHHPDYGIGDNSNYLAYMNGQVRELLSNYGTVDVLWWDSYGRGNLTNFWGIGETFALVQQLQPGVVMNNRMAELGAYNRQPAPYRGDFDTPEQKLGKYQDTRLWESCMTVVDAPRGGWSYRTDGKVKSYEETLRMLVSCATGDGNLLLDVGPDATGVIPPDQSACLLAVGEWLKQNGESIYGTRGGPFKPGEYGGTTRKGKTIYVHVFKWPDSGALKLPSLKTKLVSARLLGGGKVDATQSEAGLEIAVAESDRQKAVTVVALEFDSEVMQLPAVSITNTAPKPAAQSK